MLLFLLSLCGPSLVPKILDLCFPNFYKPVFSVSIDPQDVFLKKHWKSTQFYFYYLQSGLCVPSENLISKSVFQVQKTMFQWTFIQNLEINSEYEAGRRSSLTVTVLNVVLCTVWRGCTARIPLRETWCGHRGRLHTRGVQTHQTGTTQLFPVACIAVSRRLWMLHWLADGWTI